MLVGEAVEDRGLEVEHADHAVLVHERHHQLRARLRDEGEVAGILSYVADEDGLLAAGGGADEALVQADPRLLLLARPVGDGLAQDELALLLVEEQDAEHLVVDDALDHLGHALQQLVEVQDRRGLLADLVERGEQARVPARLAIQGGVLDGHGQVAGQHEQGGARFGVVGVRVGPFDVEHAHEPVAVDERDGELGPHSGHDGEVPRILAHVGDEERLLLPGGGADDALARLDAQAGRDHVVVALHEGGDQGAVGLGQEDVEDPVVDDPPQLARDGGHQLLGVEDGGDLGHDREQLAQELPGGRTGFRVESRQNSPW